jgi:two-component system response regulator RegX3
MHIGILEDDSDQTALLKFWLQEGAHTAESYAAVSEMIIALKVKSFDALLLDWNLPDGCGSEVTKWVRANIGWNLPIIVLTSRNDESITVQALLDGADDFVAKPPKQYELYARLQSVVRRATPSGLPIIRMGHVEIDIAKHTLLLHGKPVILTQKEFDLAVHFFQNPGKVMSRDHLLSRIWGIDCELESRTVDTHVSRIRKKLQLDGSAGWKMLPIYGYGYRIERADLT